MTRLPGVGLGRVIAAIAVCLLVPFAAVADPGDWLVEAPSTVRMGEAAPFAVVFSDGAAATVTLHYRPKGTGRFTSLPMTRAADGRYRAEIPAASTRAPELRYYVEAFDDVAGRRRRFGSPETPLSLVLLEPAPAGGQDLWLKMSVGLVPVIFILGFVWQRDRSRRRAILDQLFWVQLLAPLARMPRQRALEQASRLAEKTLEHPVHGPRQYSREQILEQLSNIRSVDRAQLEEERRRFLGEELDTLLPRQAVIGKDQTKSEMIDLTGRIGRLCAIGYVLARSREERLDAGSKAVNDLVRPLTESREVLEKIQRMLDDGHRKEAREKLAAVREEVEMIHRSMATLDQYESVDLYAATLTESAAVTPDLLCRLVEYHALNAPRSIENRRKLIVVGRLLAERDPMEADVAEGVKQSLIRRRLLLATRKQDLPQDLAERATRLRKEMARGEPKAKELQAFEARVESLTEDLGKMIFTLDGMAHAVACEVTLRKKRKQLQQLELSDMEESVEAIGDLADVGAETMQFVVDEADEPVARDFVDGILADMMRAAAEGTCAERGFYLDELEIQAATGQAEDPKWGTLIIGAAACRTAIDWIASSHAKAKQPAGKAPPPLPETLALGLLRTSTQLETDIQEQIERDVIRGQQERAKSAARVIHRLSRARLGLAVLGGYPATGYGAKRPDESALVKAVTDDPVRTAVVA